MALPCAMVKFCLHGVQNCGEAVNQTFSEGLKGQDQANALQRVNFFVMMSSILALTQNFCACEPPITSAEAGESEGCKEGCTCSLFASSTHNSGPCQPSS